MNDCDFFKIKDGGYHHIRLFLDVSSNVKILCYNSLNTHRKFSKRWLKSRETAAIIRSFSVVAATVLNFFYFVIYLFKL